MAVWTVPVSINGSARFGRRAPFPSGHLPFNGVELRPRFPDARGVFLERRGLSERSEFRSLGRNTPCASQPRARLHCSATPDATDEAA